MFVDFEKVKQDFPIEDVAQRLGLELQKCGNALRGPCPSGKGGNRALVITPAKKAFYSFGAEKGGDVINLVAFVKNVSIKDAAAWIVDKEKRPKAERGFRELEYLESDHDAVEALGFDEQVAQAVGIGHASRGIFRGKVCVPIRTPDGLLIGYIGITEAALPPKWEL